MPRVVVEKVAVLVMLGVALNERDESLINVPVLPKSHNGTRGEVNPTRLIAIIFKKTTGDNQD